MVIGTVLDESNSTKTLMMNTRTRKPTIYSAAGVMLYQSCIGPQIAKQSRERKSTKNLFSWGACPRRSWPLSIHIHTYQ